MKQSLGLYFVYLLVSVLLIWAGGGFDSGLGADPDEPAHAVTSLMLRDYLISGIGQHPLRFAESYYSNFPKVALGHYPPGYYALAGSVLCFWPAPAALVGLQAVLAAIAGLLTYLLGRRIVDPVLAAATGLVATSLPLMLKINQLVMADMLLVCLTLAALLCWTRYLERPHWRWSLTFGCVASAAILTKGSGLLLAAVPPVTLLLSQSLADLKRWRWWLAALPVGALALPWMMLTAHITKEGMIGQSATDFFAVSVPYYITVLPVALGWVLCLLLVGGLVTSVIGLTRRPMAPAEASILACLAGGGALLVLVPAGLTTRYLAPLAPPMVLIAAVGTHAVFSLLQLRWRQPLAAALLLIGLGAVAYLPQKEVQGFRETVQVALRELDPSVRSVWMVSSDARGEGAVIAEAAFLLPRRVPSPLRIYRAGKELGSSDWLGRGYQSAFTDHSTLLAHLDTLGVQWVFLDQSLPEKARVAHELLLAAALQSAPDRWHLVHQQTVTRQPGVKGPLLLYRSLANTPPSAP